MWGSYEKWRRFEGTSLASCVDELIPLTSIMQSARHKSMDKVMTYRKDMITRFELDCIERHSANNRVGGFKSINIDRHNHGTAITPSTIHQKPIVELAVWWYKTCLQYKDTPFPYYDPRLVLELACGKANRPVDESVIMRELSASVTNPLDVYRLMD